MVKQITHPYQPRPIRFLELWQVNDWTVKVYGIAATNEHPPQRLVETAKAIARQQLPQPAITSERYGAASLIAHAGTDGEGREKETLVYRCFCKFGGRPR